MLMVLWAREKETKDEGLRIKDEGQRTKDEGQRTKQKLEFVRY